MWKARISLLLPQLFELLVTSLPVFLLQKHPENSPFYHFGATVLPVFVKWCNSYVFHSVFQQFTGAMVLVELNKVVFKYSFYCLKTPVNRKVVLNSEIRHERMFSDFSKDIVTNHFKLLFSSILIISTG